MRSSRGYKTLNLTFKILIYFELMCMYNIKYKIRF